MKTIYLFFASILICFIALALPKFTLPSLLKGSVNEHKKPTDHRKANRTVSQRKATPAAGIGKPSNQVAWFIPTITATKSVSINGGGNAIPASQLDYQIVVSNAGTDATGVALRDVLVGDLTLVSNSVKATPVGVNDAYSCIGNVGLNVNLISSGILTNDVSPDNTALSVQSTSGAATTGGGSYSLNTDGTFTYVPAPGFSGSDTFTYTVKNANNQNANQTATVTITVSTPIWFIDDSYAGGGSNGTLAKPFVTVNAFQAINDAANTNRGENGDFIFVYNGTYTGSALTLRNTQKLIGQAATSSIATITGLTVPAFSPALPTTGGAAFSIANTTSTPITLGSGNEIQGVNFTSSSGTTMSGASVGALKIRDVSLTASAGQALQLTAGGVLDCIFKSISAAGAAKGISVNSSTGSFQVTGTGTTAGSGGAISNCTNRAIDLNNVSNITLKNMTITNGNTTAGASSATDYSLANGAINLIDMLLL